MQRFVIMGVSGCGKSSIGTAFATAIGGTFIDGDDLHPTANREKMASGTPLNDQDRAPWLLRVGEELRDHPPPTVVACSALKRHYRDMIRLAATQPVQFVHLSGSRQVLADRLLARKGHFMPPALLDSQLAALEPPFADEHAVSINIDQTPDAILQTLLRETGFG